MLFVITACNYKGEKETTANLTDKDSSSNISWGDEFKHEGHLMANTFQGRFPNMNTKEDGFAATSSAGIFACNGYGLFDMIGNVWEWTADYYDSDAYHKIDKTKLQVNPKGPDKSYDPKEPYSIKRVTKGGSFLCADNFCVNYRPSSRRGTSFDSGASHIGFRCVKDNDDNESLKKKTTKRTK